MDPLEAAEARGYLEIEQRDPQSSDLIRRWRIRCRTEGRRALAVLYLEGGGAAIEARHLSESVTASFQPIRTQVALLGFLRSWQQTAIGPHALTLILDTRSQVPEALELLRSKLDETPKLQTPESHPELQAHSGSRCAPGSGFPRLLCP